MDQTTLLKEVFTIQDNCMYTAEAHHFMAAVHKRKAILFKVFPAVLAAVMGILAANGIWSQGLIILAAIGASISAIANILNPERDCQAHQSAAHALSVLKQDARFLRESLNTHLTDDQFCESVKSLHARYNDLVHIIPPTSDKAFEHARKRIKDGVHEKSNSLG